MVRIDVTQEFKRQIKPLVKKYRSMLEDYATLLNELRENPRMGVELGGDMHKVRMAITSKGKGKSGGARVITYVLDEVESDTVVRLLTIYDKNEIQNVSMSFLKTLAEKI